MFQIHHSFHVRENLSGFYETYIHQTARDSLCSARVWTVTMTDKLKRVLSGCSRASNMDFVMPLNNNSTTVNPVQYYVSGDQVQPFNDNLLVLCYDLSTTFSSENGVCAFAKKIIERCLSHKHHAMHSLAVFAHILNKLACLNSKVGKGSNSRKEILTT